MAQPRPHGKNQSRTTPARTARPRRESTRLFANDFDQRDETFGFVTHPPTAFACDPLETALPDFRLSPLWVFKPDASPASSVAVLLGSPAPSPPLPAAALR